MGGLYLQLSGRPWAGHSLSGRIWSARSSRRAERPLSHGMVSSAGPQSHCAQVHQNLRLGGAGVVSGLVALHEHTSQQKKIQHRQEKKSPSASVWTVPYTAPSLCPLLTVQSAAIPGGAIVQIAQHKLFSPSPHGHGGGGLPLGKSLLGPPVSVYSRRQTEKAVQSLPSKRKPALHPLLPQLYLGAVEQIAEHQRHTAILLGFNGLAEHRAFPQVSPAVTPSKISSALICRSFSRAGGA